jgi:hypothetical protein
MTKDEHVKRTIKAYRVVIRKIKRLKAKKNPLADSYQLLAGLASAHLAELGVDFKKILRQEFPNAKWED